MKRILTVGAIAGALIGGPAAGAALAYVPAPPTDCSAGPSATCTWGSWPAPPTINTCPSTNPRSCWGGYRGPVPVTVVHTAVTHAVPHATRW